MDRLADKIIQENRQEIITDEGRALHESADKFAARGMLNSGARIKAVQEIYISSLSRMVDAVIDAYRDVAHKTETAVDTDFAAQAKDHLQQLILQEQSRLTSSLKQACQIAQVASTEMSFQQHLGQSIASLRLSGTVLTC
jgi:hypothetical protein